MKNQIKFTNFRFIKTVTFIVGMLLAGFVVFTNYAQATSTKPEVIQLENGCQYTVHQPRSANGKVEAKGSVNCTNSAYHNFKVCLRRHQSMRPDDEVRCVSGNGTWSTKTLIAVGCRSGTHTYFTEITFDGRKASSPRKIITCS